MKVKQAMHKGVNWCEINTPLLEVTKILRDQDVGAVPVGNKDRLVGMVTDRDVACRAVTEGAELSSMTAGDVMSKGVQFCSAEDEIEVALQRMERAQVRRLPVIDSNKRMVGMLSMGDISHSVSKEHCAEYISAVSSPH